MLILQISPRPAQGKQASIQRGLNIHNTNRIAQPIYATELGLARPDAQLQSHKCQVDRRDCRRRRKGLVFRVKNSATDNTGQNYL